MSADASWWPPRFPHVPPPVFSMPEPEVRTIELNDEDWHPTPPWWFRLITDWNWTTDDIDRVCGPEYRMNMDLVGLYRRARDIGRQP